MDNVKETFDVSWTLELGGLRGEFSIRELTVDDNNVVANDTGDHDDDEPGDWKGKYLLLQHKLQQKEKEAQEMRDKVLDLFL